MKIKMPQQKNKMGSNHGFTLIEMATVTAVIGLLCLILFPEFSRFREIALRAVCMNNMRNVAKAYNLYRAENRNAMPFMKLASGDIYRFFDDFRPLWRYVGQLGVYACPKSGRKFTSPNQLGYFWDGQNPWGPDEDPSDFILNPGEFQDIERNLANNGFGNNAYSLDPSNPSFQGWWFSCKVAPKGANATMCSACGKVHDVMPKPKETSLLLYERYWGPHKRAGLGFNSLHVDDERWELRTEGMSEFWQFDSKCDIVKEWTGGGGSAAAFLPEAENRETFLKLIQ